MIYKIIFENFVMIMLLIFLKITSNANFYSMYEISVSKKIPISVITHEYTHFILYQLSSNKIIKYKWFDEGITLYLTLKFQSIKFSKEKKELHRAKRLFRLAKLMVCSSRFPECY